MKPLDTHLLVPFDGSFRIVDAQTEPPAKKRNRPDDYPWGRRNLPSQRA